MERLQLIILFILAFKGGIAFGIEAFKLKEKLQTAEEFFAGMITFLLIYGSLFSLVFFYKSLF